MGKTHDELLHAPAHASTRSRPRPAIPAPDELLSEVLGLDEPNALASPAEVPEAVGPRALPSRFSLRRSRALAAEAPVAASTATQPASRPASPALDLGPLLDEPGAIRWEGAIFERVSSIEQQLQEVEERLGKRIPEVEERLLHLLETRLLRFERELDSSLADLSEHIARVGERGRFRLGLILTGTVVLVLLSLLAHWKL